MKKRRKRTPPTTIRLTPDQHTAVAALTTTTGYGDSKAIGLLIEVAHDALHAAAPKVALWKDFIHELQRKHQLWNQTAHRLAAHSKRVRKLATQLKPSGATVQPENKTRAVEKWLSDKPHPETKR